MLIPTPALIARIEKLRDVRGAPDLRLRVTVDGGGCSGFQYKFTFDSLVTPDDQVFENAVVTDMASLPFLEGAQIDFVSGIAGDDFVIKNPNAVSGCGCGVSFSIG